MKRVTAAGLVLALTTALSCGCIDDPTTLDADATGSIETAAEPSKSVAQPSKSVAQPSKPPELSPAMDAAAFRGLMDDLSEPAGEFFSDNYISNETSYLQVSRQLADRAAALGAARPRHVVNVRF